MPVTIGKSYTRNDAGAFRVVEEVRNLKDRRVHRQGLHREHLPAVIQSYNNVSGPPYVRILCYTSIPAMRCNNAIANHTMPSMYSSIHVPHRCFSLVFPHFFSFASASLSPDPSTDEAVSIHPPTHRHRHSTATRTKLAGVPERHGPTDAASVLFARFPPFFLVRQRFALPRSHHLCGLLYTHTDTHGRNTHRAGACARAPRDPSAAAPPTPAAASRRCQRITLRASPTPPRLPPPPPLPAPPRGRAREREGQRQPERPRPRQREVQPWAWWIFFFTFTQKRQDSERYSRFFRLSGGADQTASVHANEHVLN
jgi:hypothetical protein